MRKKTAKKSFVMEKLDSSWKFVKESRNYIYFSIGLFIIAVFIGAFVPAPDFILEYIKNVIKNLVEETANLNIFQLIGYILLNNLKASLSGLFLGFIFCILPFLICLVNGYVLGFVSKQVIHEAGILQLWRLLPHGIFELPAVFISLGIGLRLGVYVLKYSSDKNIFEFLKKAFWTFAFIVLPLLVVAAIIEGVLIKLLG